MKAFGWRAALYFLAAFAGSVEVMFMFFPDTWREEVRNELCPSLIRDKCLMVGLAIESISKSCQGRYQTCGTP